MCNVTQVGGIQRRRVTLSAISIKQFAQLPVVAEIRPFKVWLPTFSKFAPLDPPPALKWTCRGLWTTLVEAIEAKRAPDKRAIEAKKRNYELSNIDLTIICEKPKLNNYREQLILNLSKICSLGQNRINVKATTTERLGFTGREEGIASLCSVLLNEIS